MRLLFKNTIKKIYKSFGRFFSILLIIALGISVFLGLREATTGMLHTADNYYDKYKLMDFKITSTAGLTQNDISALKNLNNISNVVASYSIDALSDGESIRIHAYESEINQLELVEGKMPNTKKECLADYYKYKVGDIIKFTGKDANDFLTISECKVVGAVKSVLYIREEKGISRVGNGKLISFIFIDKSAFEIDYYTEVYLIGKNTIEKKSYYKDYANQIIPLNKELETLKPIRESIRYEEILKTATDKIIKIKKELNSKINDATDELTDAKKILDSSKTSLSKNQSQFLKEYENNKNKLNESKSTIITNLKEVGIEEKNLENNIFLLNEQIAHIKNQLETMDRDSNEYIDLNNQLNTFTDNYNNLVYLQNQLETINNNLISLNKEYNYYQTEIKLQEEKLEKGYTDYYEGINKLNSEKENADKKINEAKESLEDVEKPIWYLLDRTNNNGYTSYKEDIVKVDAIAKILPVFFIVVVLLMILNTLTRLIEEERTEIGILQANGFSKSQIVFSYLIYVFIAGIIGIAIGLTIGYSLIPQIIYGVFLSRYYAPKLITVVSPIPFSLVIVVTLFIMILVTILATNKELKEVPANLLRPKAPKEGKKIIFEKIKFIWSKLNFMWKTTLRNLFRYKKRIIMTIIGVAGSTALLLSGMGINDSINTIAKIQYETIIKYDSMYILDDEVKSISSDLTQIFNNSGVVNPLLIKQNAFTYSYDGKTEDVYIVVPSDTVAINNYISFYSIISKKKTSINNEGAIITKQMADQLKVEVGDTVKIRNSENEVFLIYVSNIVENYVAQYIYLNETYYKEIFGKNLLYNAIIADGKVIDDSTLTSHNVLTINYTKDILATFNSLVSGLNKIIIMIVVFACFLAFIVLYNLTIINVSERKREIATFKVLGFNNREIATFVYRETLILTIVGIAVGLFLGIYLHRYIINTSETSNVMFLRTITWQSFLLTAAIILVFSFIVQLIINKTLKKINMIDSLKSVE